MKVNHLENKISDMPILIYINHYNTDKESLEKKTGDVGKKIPDLSGLVSTNVLNTKLGKLREKQQM